MASEKKGPTADIDKIPYDAPLSFPEPTKKWLSSKGASIKSERRETIPDKEVPGCDLTGKWIVISGSNNGIGREAALSFAKWGGNLILACRDPPPTSHETRPEAVVTECLEVAKSKGHTSQVEWWEIDMSNLSSIEAFAQRWLDTGRPLDLLCNNAGMGSSPGGSSKPFMTKDGFEIVHQVNFLSHVLLTMRLLPSIAKAPQPRIICTTSCFHYLGRYNVAKWNGGLPPGLDGVKYYQDNKLYLQVWLTELQHRLLQHDELKHIVVNGCHPGYVNSGIWNLSGDGLIHTVKELFVQTAASFIAINPQQGSLTITYAATAPECGADPAIQGVGPPEGKGGGRYFNRIWEQESMPHCHDRDARLRVWRKSNDELKLQEKGLLDVLGLYSTD